MAAQGLTSTMSLAYGGGSRPPSRPTTPSHSTATLPTSASNPAAKSQPSLVSSSHPYNQTRNVSNPKSASTDDFNFAVPSLPPRLANFGRKISQMGNDFLSEFDDPGLRKPNEAPKPIPSPKPVEDVPGMGDEPVMCPFCDKPLPPMLFANHVHTPTPKVAAAGPGPGTLKRSNTTTGMKPRTVMRERSVATPLKEDRLMEALSVKAAIPEASSSVNAEALRAEVMAADKANAYAAGMVIPHADLRRWAAMAGLNPPPTPAATPTGSISSETDKPIPKLQPPPSGITASRPQSRASSTSSAPTGGFFSRKDVKKSRKAQGDDDSSEGEAQGGGYAMLTGAGSDTDDDDKEEILHDEPEEQSDMEGPSRQADTPAPAPESTPEELRNVLQEVLAKLGEMSQSHTALLSSQSTILTSLKIARSNLAMAEANTEMLEAQLKQRPPVNSTPGSVASPRVVSTPNSAQTRAIPITGGVGQTRHSEDRQRPMSLQMPNSAIGPASAGGMGSQGEKSGWGFWNNGKKKTSGVPMPSFPPNFPSPSMERPGYDFTNGISSPYSAAATPAAARGDLGRVSAEYGSSLQRSASYTQLPLSPPRASSTLTSSPIANAELAKVKESFAAATKKMEEMQKELTELKKGKLEMEAELENLSQALFEEANKMVADERKRRAEVEENLKEVREEREVLRATIKVLGGQGSASESTAVQDAIKADGGEDEGEDGEAEDGKVKEEPLDNFMPRDLDKHYEALRKSIHHVSDGANTFPTRTTVSINSPEDTKSQLPREESTGQATSPALSMGETAPNEVDSKSLDVVQPPADPNPWANSGSPSESAGGALPGEDKLRTSVEHPRTGEGEGWTS